MCWAQEPSLRINEAEPTKSTRGLQKKKKIEKYSFNIVLPRLRFQEHRTFHFHTLNSRIQSRENEGIKY